MRRGPCRPGSESQSCPWPTVWSQAGLLTSLSFGFLASEMVAVREPAPGAGGRRAQVCPVLGAVLGAALELRAW